MPEYARRQLAIPMVTIAIACENPCWPISAMTPVALPTIVPVLPGARWMKPSAIRFRKTTAVAMKMPKVTRAFSRMPRMFSPATAQIAPRMSAYCTADPIGRNAVPLYTALTVEMQAVRM